jgi:hypothetical protein
MLTLGSLTISKMPSAVKGVSPPFLTVGKVSREVFFHRGIGVSTSP